MSLTKIFVNNQDTEFDGNVYQQTGESTTAPMSQKAVTTQLQTKSKEFSQSSEKSISFYDSSYIEIYSGDNYGYCSYLPVKKGQSFDFAFAPFINTYDPIDSDLDILIGFSTQLTSPSNIQVTLLSRKATIDDFISTGMLTLFDKFECPSDGYIQAFLLVGARSTSEAGIRLRLINYGRLQDISIEDQNKSLWFRQNNAVGDEAWGLFNPGTYEHRYQIPLFLFEKGFILARVFESMKTNERSQVLEDEVQMLRAFCSSIPESYLPISNNNLVQKQLDNQYYGDPYSNPNSYSGNYAAAQYCIARTDLTFNKIVLRFGKGSRFDATDTFVVRLFNTVPYFGFSQNYIEGDNHLTEISILPSQLSQGVTTLELLLDTTITIAQGRQLTAVLFAKNRNSLSDIVFATERGDSEHYESLQRPLRVYSTTDTTPNWEYFSYSSMGTYHFYQGNLEPELYMVRESGMSVQDILDDISDIQEQLEDTESQIQGVYNSLREYTPLSNLKFKQAPNEYYGDPYTETQKDLTDRGAVFQYAEITEGTVFDKLRLLFNRNSNDNFNLCLKVLVGPSNFTPKNSDLLETSEYEVFSKNIQNSDLPSSGFFTLLLGTKISVLANSKLFVALFVTDQYDSDIPLLLVKNQLGDAEHYTSLSRVFRSNAYNYETHSFTPGYFDYSSMEYYHNYIGNIAPILEDSGVSAETLQEDIDSKLPLSSPRFKQAPNEYYGDPYTQTQGDLVDQGAVFQFADLDSAFSFDKLKLLFNRSSAASNLNLCLKVFVGPSNFAPTNSDLLQTSEYEVFSKNLQNSDLPSSGFFTVILPNKIQTPAVSRVFVALFVTDQYDSNAPTLKVKTQRGDAEHFRTLTQLYRCNSYNYTNHNFNLGYFRYWDMEHYHNYIGNIAPILEDSGVSAETLQENIDNNSTRISALEQQGLTEKVYSRSVIPSEIHALVGLEFNLYYDGFNLFPDYGKGEPGFLINVQIANEASWKCQSYRSYQRLMQAGDVGNHDFIISFMNNKQKYSTDTPDERFQTVLKVVAAQNPSTTKRICVIGDSTNEGGNVVSRMYQNFQAIQNGVPPTLIGTRYSTDKTWHHEARTEKTYGMFANGETVVRVDFIVPEGFTKEDVITVPGPTYSIGGVNVILRHLWHFNGDGTGYAIGYYANVDTSFTGTITKVGGAASMPQSLTVTRVSKPTGWSPFKNNEGVGQLDFAYYRTVILGLQPSEKIDLMFSDLGINDIYTGGHTAGSIQAIVNNCKKLIDAFIADGNGTWAVCYPKSRSSAIAISDRRHNMMRIDMQSLRELLVSTFDNGAYNQNVIICASGMQIDRWYGYPLATKKVAARIDITETKPTEGVHPSDAGYQQIGDAMTATALYVLQDS